MSEENNAQRLDRLKAEYADPTEIVGVAQVWRAVLTGLFILVDSVSNLLYVVHRGSRVANHASQDWAVQAMHERERQTEAAMKKLSEI